MAQTATTGNLADAQNTIIRAARQTAEYQAPSWQLIEKFPLPAGASTIRVPKVGQFTISELVDGQDLTDEQSIGMTTVDLTATERGAKIIVTKKLVKQNGTTPIFTMLGRQFGNAVARHRDRMVQALYSGLNGGTAYGASGATFSLANFAATIAKARGGGRNSTGGTAELVGEPFNPTYAIQHPHAVYNVTKSATSIGSATSMRVNDNREEAMLKDFFKINFGGVKLYESGNINIDSSGDAVGVIAQRDAIVGITSVAWHTEREYDASRRAWELVHWADEAAFELDDKMGAPLLFDAGIPNDTA